jgi:transcriptional regulator with XRE-family HTH domain
MATPKKATERTSPRASSRIASSPLSLADAIRATYAGLMTQVQLAGRLGVTQNTISRWSTGESEPSFREVAEIERTCGRPRGFILRAAGFVEEPLNAEEIIAMDPRIDSPRRALLLASYEAAIRQSARDIERGSRSGS